MKQFVIHTSNEITIHKLFFIHLLPGSFFLFSFFWCRYALGGYSGDDFIPTVEVFDPRRGSWTITEPMNEPRGYVATAVIGDAIYVFGGLKNKEFSERVCRL